MRIGQNPLRLSVSKRLAPVVFVVVTHLPNLEGYHAKRLEVIQTCLQTMTRRANMAHSVCVWDNGSHPMLREWIRDEIRPDILVESINLGKSAGRAALVKMLPPRTIVCCSDDDIFYYDNWLAPQIDLLKHFPNVASVTGYPVRTAFRWGITNTLAWAQKNGKLSTGKFIPREWENDFALSLGRDPEWHKDYTKQDIDYLVSYKGKEAYCTSHHCQFVGYSDVIGSVITSDNRAMGDERPLDIALDEIGLRLATTQRLSRHIGNVLDESFKELEQVQSV